MRLRGKILALTGLLLLIVVYAPVSVPGTAPCSNVIVQSGYGLLSFLVPSVAACPGPDFTMSARPSSLIINPGAAATSTIVFNSLFNFSGTVLLGWPLVPCFSYCWSVNLGSVNLSPGGTNSSTLTITTQTSIKPGNYSFFIGGGSGSLSHSVTIFFTVPSPTGPDFAMAVGNPSPIIQQGSSDTSTITISSIGGFQGTVNFVATINGNGSSRPTATVNPASLSLAPNETTTSRLTVSASASTTAGTYSLTLTATSGSISHTIVVPVTVLDPPSSSSASGSGGGGGKRGLPV